MHGRNTVTRDFTREPLVVVGSAIKCVVLAGVICGLAWIGANSSNDNAMSEARVSARAVAQPTERAMNVEPRGASAQPQVTATAQPQLD